jgi:hypothetical protein
MLLAGISLFSVTWAQEPALPDALPAALEEDPVATELWARAQAHLARRDSLLRERDRLVARMDALQAELAALPKDPATGDPLDRAAHERILARGEELRQAVEELDLQLLLTRVNLRDTLRELTRRLEAGVAEGEVDPEETAAFHEALLAWEGGVPLLPTVEVVVRPGDTPDDLRDKAAYLRDLADALDQLARMLQRRLEDLARQEGLVQGAEELLEEAVFLDEGAAAEEQGAVNLRVRIRGGGGSNFTREGAVLLTSREGSWDLSGLLKEEPESEEERGQLLRLLDAALSEALSERDSLRDKADSLEQRAAVSATPSAPAP